MQLTRACGTANTPMLKVGLGMGVLASRILVIVFTLNARSGFAAG